MTIVYSEAILGDYGPEAQTQVTPNSMFQCASNFKGFLECYGTKKVINQVKFKYIGGYPRKAVTMRWDELLYRSSLLCNDVLSFCVG